MELAWVLGYTGFLMVAQSLRSGSYDDDVLCRCTTLTNIPEMFRNLLQSINRQLNLLNKGLVRLLPCFASSPRVVAIVLNDM